MGWAARQLKPGRRPKPTDPPIKPIDGSSSWIESGPDPILDDPDLATLIVRIGMATNALTAQFNAGRDAGKRQGVTKMRDLLSSLITSAALTNEAIELAREGLPKLRPLARRVRAKEDLLERVGKLCAGKHPASPLLRRARNNIGFHWDPDVIGRSVREYGKNRKLVWVESEPSFKQTTHRLAFEVLGHVMFPEGATKEAVSTAMSEISGAMDLIIELFAASTYGYLSSIGADKKEKKNEPTKTLQSD